MTEPSAVKGVHRGESAAVLLGAVVAEKRVMGDLVREVRVVPEFDDAEVRNLIKRTAHAVLETPIEPGMGNPPCPPWEVYKPEGVAVLIANAVHKALTEAGAFGRSPE